MLYINMSKVLENRMVDILKIRKSLKKIKKKSYGDQCIKKSDKIWKDKLLGVGGFGQVYKVCTSEDCSNKSEIFAMKESKIKKKIFDEKINQQKLEWVEILIMKKYINKLVENGEGFNLPYLLDYFTCNKCDILDKDNKNRVFKNPYTIMSIELADFDLHKWFNSNINFDFQLLSSCLFQIMAGLYFLQDVYQITNNDLKSRNVLVYKIPEGGVIKYKINNRNFFVPNYGYRFVINDFGLATCFYPYTKFNGRLRGTRQTSRDIVYLGKRYAFIKNNKFLPISGKNNYNLEFFKGVGMFNNNDLNMYLNLVEPRRLEWYNNKNVAVKNSNGVKIFKKNNKIMNPKFSIRDNLSPKTLKFYNTNILPPFEFLDDTQNAIRIFIGGPQTQQRPMHKVPSKIKNIMSDVLYDYDLFKTLKIRNSSSLSFSLDPSTVSALYFIKSFFIRYNLFTK